uniref:Uncharacterized protein n=1 Tax=Podoviridae sp. ct8Lf7 TaxID=2827723 RepID=A0A8S5S088_9CAUD|nr:MAG TPA: hypothetical protein [Podoviridae sp. ct8Lf7]
MKNPPPVQVFKNVKALSNLLNVPLRNISLKQVIMTLLLLITEYMRAEREAFISEKPIERAFIKAACLCSTLAIYR